MEATEGAPRAYWEQRLDERYSLASVGYAGLGEGFNEHMYEVRRRLFLSRVGPLVGSGELDVLDVGSGTGFYIDLWRALGATRITASDLTDAAVERLENRFSGVDVIRADIGAEDPGLPERGFDAVSAFDVLFHIIDDVAYRRAFMNLASRLRPGGLLVFSENLAARTARASTQVTRSVESIEAYLREAGLELIWRRPVFVLMNTPVNAQGPLLPLTWRLLSEAARRSDSVGRTVGRALAPIEVELARRLRHAPSTEMVACLKQEARS